MLLAVFLATSFLDVYCSSECNFDMHKLGCWCRDTSGKTLFRITHQKMENSPWTVQIKPANESCSIDDVIQVLPHTWIKENESIDNSSSSSPSPTPGPGPVPDEEMLDKGYQLIGDSYYKHHTTGTYWDNARRICISEGAHLAIINSRKESEILRQLWYINFYMITNTLDEDRLFLGYHDHFQEGEYLTIFGQPLGATGFMDFDPVKLPPEIPGTSDIDCGGFAIYGQLLSLHCDYHYSFICEREVRNISSDSYINYSKGSYKGIETETPPPEGTRPRTKPGLGYILYPGVGFYRYITTAVTWDNARLWCDRQGAFLSTANSWKELSVLHAINIKVDDYFIPNRGERPCIYIGFHSHYKASEFVTIFNESIDYSNFWPGQPDNELSSSAYSGENCGSILPSGHFYDNDCGWLMPFFCQKTLKIP